MFQIGVIGCGKIAQTRHLPEYAQNKDVRLAGYYDFNLQRAKQIADQYGGIAYESVEALLADKEIDAVSVCVANNAHAEVSIAALRAGKHVLCEKPMAVTLEQCEEMVQAANEAGKYLMIGQNQRLAKAHVKAKELIQAGEIGKILSFRTTFGHKGPETWSVDPGAASWFFDKKRAAMGAMADLGVHKTDLIQYLLDDRVVETRAKTVTLDKKGPDGVLIGVDDFATCIYTTEGGVVGTMTASWINYGEEENATVLYGTEGVMKIYDNPDYSIVVQKKNDEKTYYEIDQIQTNDNQTNSGIIDMFVASLVEGREPEISGKSVLDAMRAIFASIRSSETHEAVEIR